MSAVAIIKYIVIDFIVTMLAVVVFNKVIYPRLSNVTKRNLKWVGFTVNMN